MYFYYILLTVNYIQISFTSTLFIFKFIKYLFIYLLQYQCESINQTALDIFYNGYKNTSQLDEFYNKETKTFIIPCGVTEIEYDITRNLYYKGVVNISLPDTVTDIEYPGFKNYTELKFINIPQNVQIIQKETFLNCTKLEQITISYGVKTIENNVFKNCTNLQQVQLPQTLQSIGNNTFQNCTSLEEITIPLLIQIIPQYLFADCTSLTNVNLPEGLKTIDNYAFSSCSSLFNIDIPQTVIAINNYSFLNCESLVSFTMPNSVSSLGRHVLTNCTQLKEITLSRAINENLTLFATNCSSLKQIKIPASITSISGSFNNCTSLKQIELPKTINYIGSSFNNCNALPQIIINSIWGSIGWSFQNCVSLISVIIYDGIEIIDDYTFQNCPKLTSLVIPQSVTQIDNGAFANCTGLKCVNIQNSNCTLNYPFWYTKYQNYTIDKFDKECELAVYITCYGNSSDFIEVFETQQRCVDPQTITYYYIQDNKNIYTRECPQDRQFIAHEEKPYLCLSDCQGSYPYYTTEFSQKCLSQCKNSQYIQQYNDKLYCVYVCDSQYQYIQNQTCVKQCTGIYVNQLQSNICNNTCKYQILKQERLCIDDTQCSQDLIIVNDSRIQCADQCPENFILENNQCINKHSESDNSDNINDPENPQNDNNNDNKLSQGAAIGITVAVMIFIIGTGAFIYFGITKHLFDKCGCQKSNKSDSPQISKTKIQQLSKESENQKVLSKAKEGQKTNKKTNKNVKMKVYI